MEKEVVLTPAGYDKLVEELDYLVTKRRKEIAERIKESIQFGDLSENSEYDDAKNEQAFLEGRIQQITEMLQKARVIEDKDFKAGRVSLGSWVVLKDAQDGEEYIYHVVGSAEADPINGRISNESPVGRAILGKKIGQTVEVTAPQGVFSYQVLAVSHDGFGPEVKEAQV